MEIRGRSISHRWTDDKTRNAALSLDDLCNSARGKFTELVTSNHRFRLKHKKTFRCVHRQNSNPKQDAAFRGIRSLRRSCCLFAAESVLDSDISLRINRFQWRVRHCFPRMERRRIEVCRLALHPG